ncbi:hypothetical protein GQ44DRAFT_774655 [Phaeosphaeriaceae sp. PMI808]|nr:hypothetical protein GQ44DRAFT_774655 [Phaeosphaeriaceae sp. PMI808]
MYHAYNPQVECRFFAAPREIRDAIYAQLIPKRAHLVFRGHLLHLTPCVQRDNDGDPGCASRHPNDAAFSTDNSDPTYLRRLRSEWGPHWRCEEDRFLRNTNDEADADADDMSMSPLLACKRMFGEFVVAMFDTVAIHINDIHTLSMIVLNSDPKWIREPGRLLAPNLVDVAGVSEIKELHVTLRLPIAAYNELTTNNEGYSSSSFLVPSFLSTWSQLPLAIERLRSLQRLRIWLDHDEPCSWSIVNERAILNPLVSLNRNGFDVSINLPKLHPRWETPNRHFTDDSAPFLLPIHRRYRQRYHSILLSDGSLYQQHSPDFPETYEAIEDFEVWGFATKLEAEELEKRNWKLGHDPVAEYRELYRTLVYSLR